MPRERSAQVDAHRDSLWVSSEQRSISTRGNCIVAPLLRRNAFLK
jgi:hypothetical protein